MKKKIIIGILLIASIDSIAYSHDNRLTIIKNVENMKKLITSTPADSLYSLLQGTWWLLSREDYTENGDRRIDPTLGADPIGILSYAKDHFAAQFMKRDRTEDSGNQQMALAGKNNTTAIGGYDAYFGTIKVDKETGKVAHTLLGSITPSNIGMTVYRNLKITEDQLVIELETTTQEGEPITRTLTWKRIN